jgi:phospholipid/cholesterol/gamma-HCH transport system substrate-binding protein
VISKRAVGAGAFVLTGLLLFAVALFMIGERRMLFERRFTVYTEFSRLGELEPGAPVRVAGAGAGEVVDIEPPSKPSDKFRVKMEVREALHPIVRTDSVAVPQIEGLVGGVFVNIGAGTDQAPPVAEGGTIPGREPFQISDLMQQASDTMMMIGDTVATLRGDAETAMKEIAGTTQETHALIETMKPDLEAMAANGRLISNDTRELVAKINSGQGTVGRLVNNDDLYRQLQEVTRQAQDVMGNLHQVSDEARRAIVDFRSKDGAAQGGDEAQLPAARLFQQARLLRPRRDLTRRISGRHAGER